MLEALQYAAGCTGLAVGIVLILGVVLILVDTIRWKKKMETLRTLYKLLKQWEQKEE